MSAKIFELSKAEDLSKDISSIVKSCDNNANICKICYDSQEKDLISPCKCSGSLSFTHNECLKLWITQRFPEIRGASCEICKEKYKISFEYSRQWIRNLSDYSRTECLKKLISLLIGFIVIAIITIVAYLRYVDFKTNLYTSVLVVVLCFSALFINLLLMAKVYICAHIYKQVRNWKIISK